MEQTQTLESSLGLLLIVEQRQELSKQIKAMQKLVDGLSDTITGTLVREGLNELEVGDYTVRYITSERRTLEKARLVELGVSTETIRAAEKVSRFGRIDVREKK